MSRRSAQATCANLNHTRSNPRVRFCLDCGGAVNPAAPPRTCGQALHQERMRERARFCADCGRQLIADD
ncbi:MAG: hypothetical protein R3F62_21025 [Planctomycetota bacterium]